MTINLLGELARRFPDLSERIAGKLRACERRTI